MSNEKILLSLKGISKQYPGVLALNAVDLDIRENEIHALIGENGAGKSTLIKILAGAIRPDEGIVTFEGDNYEQLSPTQAKELGISVVYQEFNLMDSLSIMENVFVGNIPKKKGLVDYKKLVSDTNHILRMIDAPLEAKDLVADLSTAHKQLVEIAKSLSRTTKLMILDEPTAPLTSKEVDMLFNIIQKLRDDGVTIILITHRLDEIYQICDRVTVLRDGQKILTSDVKDIEKPELIRNMVGRDMNNSYPSRNNEIGEEVLKVENLCGNGVKNINFELHKGEILGFAGLVGAGRTEIMRVLYGADPKDSGEVYLKGRKYTITSPLNSIKNGIVLLPEDRKTQGVLLRLPINQNIVLASLKKLITCGMLSKRKEKKITSKQISALRIACWSPNQLAATLSGGNQQKVVLAKWIAADADVLIFDEPTRGIDVGAKYEFYLLMNQLCKEGKAIIMISSELDELLGLVDRVVVLYEGKQMGIMDKTEFNPEIVLKLASGEA